MGKLSKKLIVYLDQNFISEMAKADINLQVKPEFKKIYELLHKGFIDEKLVVPISWSHRVETSLVPRLKKRIIQYLKYLGQVSINPSFVIEPFQVQRAARNFLGENIDVIYLGNAFSDAPDKRIKYYDIDFDSHPENFFNMNDRIIEAQNIDNVRLNLQNQDLNFDNQYLNELEAERFAYLSSKLENISYLFRDKPDKIHEFIYSDRFAQIPIINTRCRLWSKILINHKTRKIRSGDSTDVDILSSYLPYVDIIATDFFMADQLRSLGLDKEYNTIIFDPKKEGLEKFENFLIKFLAATEPVNSPIVSIFVLSDDKIKENSFDFFKNLGVQTLRIQGRDPYVEIFAFDDGKMPKYAYKEPKMTLPFYGLQEITSIKIDNTMSKDDILNICEEKSRANKFILIDKHRDFPEDFIETLIQYCIEEKEKILNFKVHNKIKKTAQC